MAGYHTRYQGDHRRYVGRRRAVALARRHRGRRARVAGPRRIALVAATVAAVLAGTGALAKTLPFEPVLPVGFGAPAAAPDRRDAAAPPAGVPAVPPADPAASPAPAPTGAPVQPPSPPAPAASPPPIPDPTAAPAGEPPPPDPDPVTIVYEAEQAELSGFVKLFEVEAASGGGVIGTIGLSLSNSVQFPEVTVDTAGAYELTLYYVSAPDRQGMVSINGGEMVTVDFPALGNGRTVGSVSIPVELAAGPNVVWFGNPDRPAPALDRITVTG